MKKSFAIAALLGALTVPALPAADHVCVKDNVKMPALGKSACVKQGGRWEKLADSKKSQTPSRKGSK